MRNGCVYSAHRQPSSKRRGGKGAIIRQPEPSARPCNCDHPCIYGKGSDFCWPCMKEMMEGMHSGKK